MNESGKTAKVNKELKDAHNCEAIKLVGSIYSENGLPDSVIIKDGLHIWVEYKDEDEVASPLQKAVHSRMRKHGAHVFVVRFAKPKEWIIDDLYFIRFKTHAEGVRTLLDTLIHLCNSETLRRRENERSGLEEISSIE